MPLTDFEKGYLAGLLDGEGTISVYKNTEKRIGRKRSKLGFTLGCHIRISNTNVELLRKVSEITGGKIYLSSKNNRKKKVYVCQINDKAKIVEILEQLFPFLIEKKKRASKIIEFCKSRINRPSLKSGYTDKEIETASNWKNQ